MDEIYSMSTVCNGSVHDTSTWRSDGLTSTNQLYTELPDCDECSEDLYLATSIVGQEAHDLAGPGGFVIPDGVIDNWDAHICQATDIKNLDMTLNANQRHASRCISLGIVSVMKVRATAATKTWINNNGEVGYFIGNDGKCRQYAFITAADQNGCIPKFIDNLTYWWNGRQQAAPFYANILAIANVYPTECDCYDNGGHVGTLEDLCDPPIPPPIIDRDLPRAMNVNEHQRVALSIAAHHVDQLGNNLGSVGLKYDWWFVPPGGTPQRITPRARSGSRGYVINKAELTDAGEYFVRVYNKDKNGNYQYTESHAMMLNVLDVPTKLYPDDQEVALVTIFIADLNLIARVGGNQYVHRTILGNWVTNAGVGMGPPDFPDQLPSPKPLSPRRWTASNVNKWRDVMNNAWGLIMDLPFYAKPQKAWCAKATMVQIKKWSDLTPTLRGLTPTNNDEDDRYSVEKANLPNDPDGWEEDLEDLFPRSL
jgi:hypothetical protein